MMVLILFLSTPVLADNSSPKIVEPEQTINSILKSLTNQQRQSIQQILSDAQPQMKALYDSFLLVAPKAEAKKNDTTMATSQLWQDASHVFKDIDLQLAAILTNEQMVLHRAALAPADSKLSTKDTSKESENDSAFAATCYVDDCWYSPYYEEWARYLNYVGYTYAYYHYAYESSNSNAYNAYYNALTAGGYIKSAMKYAGPAFFAATYVGNIAYEDGSCYTKIAFDYANVAEDYAYSAFDYAEETYSKYGGTYGYYSYQYNYYAMLYTDYARDYAYNCQNCCMN